MSDGPSISEQYEREREMGRHRRDMQGANTALDLAEVRHNAIRKRVWFMRSGAAVMTSILVGWVGSNPGLSWMLSLGSLMIAMTLANAFGALMNFTSGKFQPGIWQSTENLWFVLFGVAIAIGGLGFGAPGMSITGFVLMITPWAWSRWSRSVMGRTDFSRMKAQASRQSHISGIME